MCGKCTSGGLATCCAVVRNLSKGKHQITAATLNDDDDSHDFFPPKILVLSGGHTEHLYPDVQTESLLYMLYMYNAT